MAHVIGLLLERQPQQRHTLVIEVDPGFRNSPINQIGLLVFVDAIYRLQQVGLLSGTLKLIDERLNILAEAGTASAVGNIRSPRADTIIRSNPPLEVFHAHVGESLANARPDPVPE